MGILDNISGLLGGSGKGAVPITLDDGEVEVARVVACTVKGAGRPWVGGDLVLTNRRLLFSPLETKDVAALLSYGLKKVGAPAGSTAVGWIQKEIAAAATDVSSMASAAAYRPAALLNPPTITVGLRDGRNLEFGILASRMSPSASKSNEAKRDEFLRLLQTSI